MQDAPTSLATIARHLMLPKTLGFRMPAEWAQHKRTWMLWPHRMDNWRLDSSPAKIAYANVAKAIARFEPVKVGVHCAAEIQVAEAMMGTANGHNIEVVVIESDDSWIRDTGPTFVLGPNDSEAGGICWQFNAWGGIYEPYRLDQLVSSTVLSITDQQCMRNTFVADFILEGGSIHVDGEGTILTTEECLLNSNRNPHLSKDVIERLLCDYLNGEKVIWLPLGLFGDEDTNGHIDNFCCFAKPAHVLLAWADDPSDPQHQISRDAYEILSAATDAKGRRLTVTKVPIPPPMFYTEEEVASYRIANDRKAGQRLAGSYINFYICNGGLICPSFDEGTDQLAVEILKESFPGRTVVLVPGREILLGGGNIHCITQQEPLAFSDT